MAPSAPPIVVVPEAPGQLGARSAPVPHKARTGAYRGASPDAIQHHYDVGNAFYALWLDPTLTYTCALWDDDPRDTLEAAQIRKLDHHATQMRAAGARSVLDIGCGWGSMLRRLVEAHGVTRAVGLTLSRAQADYVAQLGVPGVEVQLQNWFDHRVAQPYDAIVSIGALEHFARLALVRRQKVAAYRAFFRRCHALLAPGGRLSLQTIAFDAAAAFGRRAGPFLGRLSPRRIDRILDVVRAHPRLGAAAERLLGAFGPTPDEFGPLDVMELALVFEESTLPTLADIAEAADGVFEIEALRNDRSHYARTGREWLRRFEAARAEATALVGEAVAARYARFLRIVPRAFDSRGTTLLRLTLRRLG